jgi:hypothetical protein
MPTPSDASRNNSNFPSLFKAIQTIWKRERSITEVIIHVSNALALMIVGHLIFSYLTSENIIAIFNTVDSDPLLYPRWLYRPND